jgi:hypothetical protein
MRLLKTVGGAGALVGAALIGGTLISSTLAGSDGSTGTASDAAGGTVTEIRIIDEAASETFLDTLAAELGVDRADLGPAALAAANAVIDAKVAAGDLDEDDAAALKERLAELDDPEALLTGPGFLGRAPGGPAGHGFAVGAGIGGVVREAADAAADALGVERADLVEALHDGSSLEEVAADRGVSYDAVKQAVLGAIRAELDDAVADEDLTQERADEVLARVTDWLDDGGEPGEGFLFRHRGPRG